MYHSFWYIDPDPFYEQVANKYHKKARFTDNDLGDRWVSFLFHVIFPTDASDDHSISVPQLHCSVQALKTWQITHKLFFFLPVFAEVINSLHVQVSCLFRKYHRSGKEVQGKES